VVYGQSRDRITAGALAEALTELIDEGTLYLGYPVLATADEKVEVDALLVSRAHGVAAFLLPDSVPASDEDWGEAVAEQDRLYGVLESHLGRHDGLRRGRHLVVIPQTATVFPSVPNGSPGRDDGFYGDLEGLPAWVASLESIDEDLERAVQAALQRVTTIKPAKRRASVQRADSRGAVLKEIEKGIANLDRWQKRAAIESPDGPQRIRGLAGSGKTVVLALKAAYWHTQHPRWQIAITFHTRALYQQIDDLITRFTFEHSNDRPDPAYLKIAHSWGSSSRPGVYSLIAAALNVPPRDFGYARATYGFEEAFQGICRELLDVAKSKDVEPIFDAVLIDEAQDLPPEFFQLVYLFTRDPKRIVWGYDELQRLSEAAMPDTRELFGVGRQGEALVTLDSGAGEPERDIVLPVCYRNTPWALATAHAVGLGVYRDEGLLQHPDDPSIWRDIGYRVVSGELEAGSRVVLERAPSSYPSYFPEFLSAEDAVVLTTFDDEAAQDKWVAEEVSKNLTEDELEPDDILIVLPDSYRSKSRAPRLIRRLMRHNISAHLVGVNSSVDEVFFPGSIAIAGIFRAKGNEAPMVYVLDSQYGANTFNAVTRRNTLFTAITRSRAWVRVCGWGDRAPSIAAEVEAVKSHNYRLGFTVPTPEELAELRHIHRDRPEGAEKVITTTTSALNTFLEALERGDVDFEDLPPAIRTRLAATLERDSPTHDE
jgi:superfamily I DNA and RNA helicase